MLAGIETPRTWGGSIAVVDVVRAALGEVASYERVAIQQVEPATIGGTVASEIAPSTHLGDHIAGRLAARHGLAVHLDGAGRDRGSIRATITVSPALIAFPPAEATEPVALEHPGLGSARSAPGRSAQLDRA